MDIQNYRFTEDEIEKIDFYEKRQKNKRLARRFIALKMIAYSIDLEKILKTLSISMKTLENWFIVYIENGIDDLNSFQYKGRESLLGKEEIEKLIAWVEAENPSNIKEVVDFIFLNFNLKYSVEGVRKILRKHGFKFLKPKIVPGNPPSEEEQIEFVGEYFEMKKECEPGTAFLFGDGMHLTHQNISGYCWGHPEKFPILETNTGRTRLNILGAYNPDTFDFVHLTGEENCNGERVVKFFDLVMKIYRNSNGIIMFLDNAKYFRAKVVREWLENNPKFKLKFLPAYSPNLNLIERFWRFTKGKLVKNTYYKKYKTFRAKVFQFLNNTREHIDELKTLMTENFQIIRYKH